MHLVRHMKNSASESKPFQSRSRGEIPGQARRKERLSRSKLKEPFLIDSDAELFMYLIQGIRFGSWKDRRLIAEPGLRGPRHDWRQRQHRTYLRFTNLIVTRITNQKN